MTHSPLWSTRAAAAAILLVLAGCKKASRTSSDNNQVASLLFDVSSPAARVALAIPVDYRLTDANYSQWEQAQRFLDALPRSAFAAAPSASGNAIDRAVATLEASPRARTAIERTGLSVRDFVLETVALAQATEAGAGKPPRGSTVPPAHVPFVHRNHPRILQARAARRATRARVDTYGDADTTSVGAEASANNASELQTDSARRDGQPTERPKSPTDTVRDTIPER